MVFVSSLRAWLVLLCLFGCTSAPTSPAPPDAPVLEGDGVFVVDFRWTLKGTAPADTIVRLHLDASCGGPALRDFTSAELAEGVALELVGGTPNVFSAVSIDTRGLSSACSAPIHVNYQRPGRPSAPQVRITPPGATRATLFTIQGTANDGVTVQLFEDNQCLGVPLGELAVPEFHDVGFIVEVEPNGSRSFTLRAINALGEGSPCTATYSVVSDQTPPVVHPYFLSPMPSPELSAYVSISYDAASGTTFLGPGCTGPVISNCNGYACSGFAMEFPMASRSSWSATAADALGNTSDCANAQSWEWDPSAPAPEIVLMDSGSQFLRALVPASSWWVEIFDGPTCGDPDHLRVRLSAVQLAGTGFYTGQFQVPSDGGVLVAHGLDVNLTTVSACSQPVPWY